MNGQPGADQGNQGGQESHLSYILNAANGQNALMGYPGAQGLRYGVSDASLEEQILQRASALRAEALMQQQQQQAQQRHHQLGAALAALQQQQQFSSLVGLNPNFAALSPQEQEALLGRAAALRELGIAGGPAPGLQGADMDRLRQLEMGRLDELERRRLQLAAIENLSRGARPGEITSGVDQLGQDSTKSDSAPEKTSAPPPDKSKDDLRKTPGTVIVPCRARGMPMDHNFKTAYFVISEDAKHGEDLVCSYFACRNGGVKFRYCAHCMAPVAKRNFCRRHDHGMSAKGGDAIKDDEEDSADHSEGTPDKEETEKEKKVPSKSDKVAPRSSLDVLSKAATSSFLMQAEPNKAEKRKKPVEDEDSDDADPELANISKKRRKMWSALLIKRPRTKDPRHLSSWLNEVLTVSDFETPLEQMEPAEAKSNETPGVPAAKKHKAEKDPGTSKKEKEKKNSAEKEKKKKKSTAKTADEGSSGEPKGRHEKEEKKGKYKEQERGKANGDFGKDDREKPESKKEPEEEKGKKNAEKKFADGSSDKRSPKRNGTKEPSPSKKDSEDGFVGSFADWRDRKKEKALIKKGSGSLKK